MCVQKSVGQDARYAGTLIFKRRVCIGMLDDDESGSDVITRLVEQDALVTALLRLLQRLATVPPARAVLCRILTDTEAPWPDTRNEIQFLVRYGAQRSPSSCPSSPSRSTSPSPQCQPRRCPLAEV